MNCLDCQAWLQSRMDGEQIAAPEGIERHWAECAVCREQHEAMVRLLEGMQRLPKPTLSPSFSRDLTTRILHDRRQRQVRMRRRVFVTMALAASILALLLVGYNMMPPPKGDDGTRSPLVQDVQKPPEAPKIKPAPQLADTNAPRKAEPRSPIASFTERWADTTRDHAAVIVAATDLDAIEKLSAIGELPALDPGVREAGQEVTDGVRAVTRNARRAFDFLAREIPMPDVEPKEN